ncbi:MAG: DNA double-strand break repair nuclease NurA [Candidatus Thorarchaeota archaeon]
MGNTENDTTEQFGYLPMALVEMLVSQSEKLGKVVTDSLESVSQIRDSTRKQLNDEGKLGRVDDLPTTQVPTTCGVDGAYIVEALIGYDLVIATGLATEGLTPPSEKRHWEEPHFTPFINIEHHHDDNKSYSRALMMCYELAQAEKAPHDVIMMDGSFVSPITSLNQALTKNTFKSFVDSDENSLLFNLYSELSLAIKNYHIILDANRSDKCWISIPKYTSKREMGAKLEISEKYDDRALCTLLLKPGEFAGPFKMEDPTSRGWSGYHLNRDYMPELDKTITEIENMLTNSVCVMYYRPSPSNPAIRIEIPKRIATNRHRLALVMQAIRSQSAIPGLLEPQPLHYADQMAKSVGVAIPAIKEMVSRFSSRNYSGDVNDVFFILHGYRTEGE